MKPQEEQISKIKNNFLEQKNENKGNKNLFLVQEILDETPLPNLLGQDTLNDIKETKIPVFKDETEKNKNNKITEFARNDSRDSIYKPAQPTRIEGSLVILNDGTARIFGYQTGSIPNVG